MTKGKPQTTKNNTAQENLTERLERKETVRGTALTITGGFLWGIAGVFGKYTFEYKGVTATWIVNVRLIIAGIILSGGGGFQCRNCNCSAVYGTGNDYGTSCT